MTRLIVLLVFSCLMVTIGNGQTPKPAAATPVTFTSKFGAFTDSSQAFASDLRLVTNLDLKVTDNKGATWTIVKYRFGWRRKEESDDYKTGKRKTILQFYGKDVLSSSKIPDSWQNELKENLKPGEEIMFEEIIVQNTATKKMMLAPSLHIFLK